ncbi:MAG: NAD-dependent deacetylase [Rhizobiales bacterium]|nr:NAD-dependent deacetylase [Hyphomicrobiales bacterium]
MKDRLKQFVDEASRIVGFTGAGISTECGIPDFRSPGGIWSKYKPIDFQTFMSTPEMRREALSRYLKIREHVGNVSPGRGHRALAEMARGGRLTHVVTQNIDGLHQASGIDDDRIVELHGNGTYAKCLECDARHELDWIALELDRIPGAPSCLECGGIVKTATISFGQAMPQDQMIRAQAATLDCDLFLAIGTSLVVQPAAEFPLIAKQNGARLVIINREETPLDSFADLVIYQDIGDVLEIFLP